MNVPGTVLVSFPKSGQTLFTGLVELWTGRPTMPQERNRVQSVINEISANDFWQGPCPTIDTRRDAALVVGHNPNKFKDLDNGARKFIELVRDPVEAVVSYWVARMRMPHSVAVESIKRDGIPQFVREKILHRHNRIVALRAGWAGPWCRLTYDELLECPLYTLQRLTEKAFLTKDDKTSTKLEEDISVFTEGIMVYKAQSGLGSQTGGDKNYWSRLIGHKLTGEIRGLADQPTRSWTTYGGAA